MVGVKCGECMHVVGLVQKIKLGLGLKTWVESDIKATGFTDEQSLKRDLGGYQPPTIQCRNSFHPTVCHPTSYFNTFRHTKAIT